MQLQLAVDHFTIWRWVQRYAPELNRRCRPESMRSCLPAGCAEQVCRDIVSLPLNPLMTNDDVAAVVADIFDMLGYDVVTADCPRAALEVLRTMGDRIGLLFAEHRDARDGW